jgi:hypothetical protein
VAAEALCACRPALPAAGATLRRNQAHQAQQWFWDPGPVVDTLRLMGRVAHLPVIVPTACACGKCGGWPAAPVVPAFTQVGLATVSRCTRGVQSLGLGRKCGARLRLRVMTEWPIAQRFAAVMPARFMGARVPLPEPKWKQQPGLEGTVATNLDQATGLERAEMLAAMEGRNLFDDAVSAASRRHRHRHSEVSRCMRRGSSRGAAQARPRV